MQANPDEGVRRVTEGSFEQAPTYAVLHGETAPDEGANGLNRNSPNIVVGSALSLAGGILLLGRLGLLSGAADLPLGGVLILACLGLGVLLLSGGALARLAGFALLVGGVLIVVPNVVAEGLGAPLVLGSVGTALLVLYLRGARGNWWPLVPAGVLITLAIVAAVKNHFAITNVGWLVMFGLALTFVAVAIAGRLRWPYMPATVLAGIGLLASASTWPASPYLFAGLVLAAGLYLVVDYLRRR